MQGKFHSQYRQYSVRRTRIAVCIATSLSLIFGVALVLVLLPLRTAPKVPVSVEKSEATAYRAVKLFTVESEIGAGTALGSVRVRELQWPASEVSKDAVRNLSDLEGRYARITLVPGNPIRLSETTNERPLINPLGSLIPPGYRAIAIQIDDVIREENLIGPQSIVDVTLTYRESDRLKSKIIVENALVGSRNGDIEPYKESDLKTIKQSRTLTLVIKTEDALKISVAQQLGKIGLLLKSEAASRASPGVLETDEFKVLNGEGAEAPGKLACQRGTAVIDGRKVVIGCDDSLTALPK